MERSKLRAWTDALRLRTLPLSWAGVITAAGLGAERGCFSWGIFVLMMLTASLLQILSNMANDYGDFVKGTDNESRVGPARALQKGEISRSELLLGICVVCGPTPLPRRRQRICRSELLLGICVVCGAAMVSGLALVLAAFGLKGLGYVALFLALGALCIWAAVKYTVGRTAYGYVGLGDAAVFVFFGLVPVAGGMFLYTGRFDALSLMPAAAIGLLSAGVLNLNNMRDKDNDIRSGKRTLASRMNMWQGKLYQSALILAAMALVAGYQFSVYRTLLWYLPAALCLLNIPLLLQVKKREEFDGLLKVLSISTLFLSVVLAVAVNI